MSPRSWSELPAKQKFDGLKIAELAIAVTASHNPEVYDRELADLVDVDRVWFPTMMEGMEKEFKRWVRFGRAATHKDLLLARFCRGFLLRSCSQAAAGSKPVIPPGNWWEAIWDAYFREGFVRAREKAKV